MREQGCDVYSYLPFSLCFKVKCLWRDLLQCVSPLGIRGKLWSLCVRWAGPRELGWGVPTAPRWRLDCLLPPETLRANICKSHQRCLSAPSKWSKHCGSLQEMWISKRICHDKLFSQITPCDPRAVRQTWMSEWNTRFWARVWGT